MLRDRPTRRGLHAGLLLAALGVLGGSLVGCGDGVRPPSPEELARFEAAGPAGSLADAQAGPTVDMTRVLQAKIVTGPYRAVPGDVLRLEMPGFLEQEPAQTGADSRQIYNCRIGEDGAIVLPIIGPLAVQGKSLTEIEAAIAAQYYPKYVAAPLPVYVSVLEYQTQRVSILGAVAQPGIHSLRHDQMSLVALLMQAGGIVGPGASVIRITRAAGPAAGPTTVAAKYKTVPSSLGSPRRAQVRPAVPQAVFEREGPLRTTGWLRVEDENGRVSHREWLDIGNEPQRREFLGALTSRQGRGASGPSQQRAFTEDLGVQLARLGAYLDERPMIAGPGPGSTPDGRSALVAHRSEAEGRNDDGRGNLRRLPLEGQALRPAPTRVHGWQTWGDGRFVALAAATVGSAGGTHTLQPMSEVGTAERMHEVETLRPMPEVATMEPVPEIATMEPLPEIGTMEPIPEAATMDLMSDAGTVERMPEAGTVERMPEVGTMQPMRELGPGETAYPNVPPSRPDPISDPALSGTQTLVLPVRGLNIPFSDVVLQEGDTVVVEPPQEQSIAVLGLVTRPGNMPYPPGVQRTLIEAIAFAGGLDPVADPRYVSVYRLAADGEVVSTTLQLVNPRREQQLTETLALPLKPGDVVSVENTPRTYTNAFLYRFFRVSLGLYVSPEELWNDD